MDDITPTGRWMTYDEIAATRGIKRSGAVRLVQRQKWRRQAGNDGYARILVPHDEMRRVRGTPQPHPDDDRTAEGARDSGDDGAATVAAAFDAALAAIKEAHAGEIAALATIREAQVAEIAALQERLTDAQAAADQARVVARRAQETADELRGADDARKARGRWSRLRAAWRGE